MKLTHYVGIDVSKATFSFCLLHNKTVVLEAEMENTDQGVLEFIQVIGQYVDRQFEQLLFCMEHTGLYSMILLNQLHATGAQVSAENATRIKASLGFARGKSDKMDAKRIAEYAERFQDRLPIWQPKRKSIEQLQHLTSLRDRLIKMKYIALVPLQEVQGFIDEDEIEMIEKPSREIIELIDVKMDQIEEKIKKIILADQQLRQMVKLVKSIPGIGPVISTEMIIRTNGFQDFKDGKKLACHVGVAPFEHSSGTSYRGRTKVSHKAHKRLKTLLHLGAMSVISGNNEFSEYYRRKVAQGKNKTSVINAIRNKLIHRAFALVKNNTMYDKNYQYSFVKP